MRLLFCENIGQYDLATSSIGRRMGCSILLHFYENRSKNHTSPLDVVTRYLKKPNRQFTCLVQVRMVPKACPKHAFNPSLQTCYLSGITFIDRKSNYHFQQWCYHPTRCEKTIVLILSNGHLSHRISLGFAHHYLLFICRCFLKTSSSNSSQILSEEGLLDLAKITKFWIANQVFSGGN